VSAVSNRLPEAREDEEGAQEASFPSRLCRRCLSARIVMISVRCRGHLTIQEDGVMSVGGDESTAVFALNAPSPKQRTPRHAAFSIMSARKFCSRKLRERSAFVCDEKDGLRRAVNKNIYRRDFSL
jgi:hypothetical protein